MPLIYDFIEKNLSCPMFMFIEAPSNLADETVDKESKIIQRLHRDIYYLDGISGDNAMDFLDIFGEVLLNDGMSAFGIGTPNGEIGKYRYNEVQLFSGQPEEYVPLFEKHSIIHNQELVSPWELINAENAGVSTSYEDSCGRDIYTVVEILKSEGMYRYEQTEQ